MPSPSGTEARDTQERTPPAQAPGDAELGVRSGETSLPLCFKSQKQTPSLDLMAPLAES